MPRHGDVVAQWGALLDPCHFFVGDDYIEEHEMGEVLRSLGIKKLALAGECGPADESVRGCVGTLYELLTPTLEARGIRGCIFPQKPCTKIFDELRRDWRKERFFSREELKLAGITPQILRSYRTMLRNLYDNALPFPRAAH